MLNYKNFNPNFPVDLSNCQDEPIHVPGAIQPFGVLLGFDQSSLNLLHVSQNALELIPGLREFGKKELALSELLTISGDHGEINLTRIGQHRTLVKVSLKGSDSKLSHYNGVVYKSQSVIAVELEVEAPSQPSKHTGVSKLTDLSQMMGDVFRHEDIPSLLDFTSQRIKDVTGFDRVMIYKYDEEWNGEVVSEAKEEFLEPFLGLHYPASDIPAQARALYERNLIRIIPTIDYAPSTILGRDGRSFDLSDSIIRSVSPIHLEYLRNMGVSASMSVSIIINGKLWGLVACHHYKGPHFVPVDVRVGCENFAQLVAKHVKSLELANFQRQALNKEHLLHEVIRIASENPFHLQSFQFKEGALLELFDATGIVIRIGEETVRLGTPPSEAVCAELSKLLIDRTIYLPLTINSLRATFPAMPESQDPNVAGVMALSLASRHNYYIICVRPEVKLTVSWAGDPRDKEKLDGLDPAQRLRPRGSFKLWQEIKEGFAVGFTKADEDILKRFALLFVKVVIDRKENTEKTLTELRAINQAKDEFVATVSHELRTPLNSIIGWTEMALSKDLPVDRIPEALKIIQRNARSQNQLINDLLDVSRIISGKMKLSVRNMSLSEITDAVILSFAPAAEAKKIKIISSTSEESDSIIGDPGRVQQVIWNLISNAIKFSPKNAKIWVSVSRVSSHLQFVVRDEGEGVAPENLERIFGRFEQVDSSISRKSGGLGLGLAICKHIVELHGGSISAESEGLGRGTTFRVKLPISPLKISEAEIELPIGDEELINAQVPAENTELKGMTILVVEDEPDAQRFMKLLLESYKSKVLVASNGLEALKVLESDPGVSVILSDIGMPEMDGYKFIRAVRSSPEKKISGLCAIALTAFSRPQDRILAMKSGFDNYISKPVEREELVAVIGSACKTKTR